VPTSRRTLWPWLLGAGLLLVAIVGGFFAYDRIQDQLNESRPVAVGDYVGLEEMNAVQQINDAGLEPEVRRLPSTDTEEGFVFEQDPGPGNRVDRGNIVTILVSTGKPRTRVPNVVGMSVAEALQTLSDANLRANTADVFSDRPEGTVTGQAPAAGEMLVEGSRVRINVSQGTRPITVPSVLSQPAASAESQLRGLGFDVVQTPVEDDEPAGTVVGQSPAGGETARKGSTITLRVSEGPQTTAIPDVRNQDADTATATLEEAGFTVRVQRRDTDDPLLDNVVIEQRPEAGQQAEPGTAITLTVGRFVEQAPPPAPPPTPPTTTDDGTVTTTP
jgi:eukaryotic-like serine/threonine-protein kinase